MSITCEKDFTLSVYGFPVCDRTQTIPDFGVYLTRPVVKDYDPLTFFDTCAACAASAQSAWDGFFTQPNSVNGCDWRTPVNTLSHRGQELYWAYLTGSQGASSYKPWQVLVVCANGGIPDATPVWSGNSSISAFNTTPAICNQDNPVVRASHCGVGGVATQVEIVLEVPPP